MPTALLCRTFQIPSTEALPSLFLHTQDKVSRTIILLSILSSVKKEIEKANRFWKKGLYERGYLICPEEDPLQSLHTKTVLVIYYLASEARKAAFLFASAFFPDLLIQYCVKTFFFLLSVSFSLSKILCVWSEVVRVKIYWFCQLHFLVRVCWLQKLPTLWWKLLPLFLLENYEEGREKRDPFLGSF